MEIIKKYYLLGLIFLLAIFLRFYNLSANPPGLTWDEASLGYNAYSILKTGRDEYGNFLPLHLKSFGDFKPALYAYLDIPFVAIFGLNELSVRLPSAIFGVFGVLGIFWLVNELFKNKALSFLAAFFLSISSWHLQFSRPAFEANVALTLNIFGIYFFIKGLSKSKWMILSALFFGLSLFTYQGSKLFIPLIIVVLSILYLRNLKSSIYSKYAACLLCGFFLIMLFTTFWSGRSLRLATLNFFAYQRSEEVIRMIAKEDGLDINSSQFQLLHGEWWAYVRGLFERYLIYFSPKMLFIEGDYSQRHRVPDLGTLYYFSAILIPVGLIYFIKFGILGGKLLFLWLIIASVPAVLSRDLISTLRALNMVIPFTILEAGGLYYLVNTLRRFDKKWFRLGLTVILVTIFFNFLIYLDRYLVHSPKEYSKYWLYGYPEMVKAVNQIKSQKNYNKIVITDIYGQPYIYYLFYSKYPPADFQKQAILDQPTVDVGTIRKIDDIEFRHIYWPHDRGEKNSLFIGTLEELPDQDILPFKEYQILKEIKFLNGETAFRIVETK